MRRQSKLTNRKLTSQIRNPGFLLATNILLLCAASVLSAQTPRQTPNSSTETFVSKATQQIKLRFAQIQAEEIATLHVKQEALKQAEVNQIKLKEHSYRARTELSAKASAVEAAELRVKDLQSASPGDERMKGARDELRRAEKEKEAAQLALTDLTNAEEIAKYNVMMARVEINKFSQESATNNQIRGLQLQKLDALATQWHAHPTPTNLIALTDEITSLSCAGNVYANPFWTTTPKDGALIFYQTIGERNRNEGPHRITGLSNSSQKVCQGRYYVWAERVVNGQQKPTSDKNAVPFDIALDTTSVVVVENQ
jgi:hypothetical protein